MLTGLGFVSGSDANSRSLEIPLLLPAKHSIQAQCTLLSVHHRHGCHCSPTTLYGLGVGLMNCNSVHCESSFLTEQCLNAQLYQ